MVHKFDILMRKIDEISMKNFLTLSGKSGREFTMLSTTLDSFDSSIDVKSLIRKNEVSKNWLENFYWLNWRENL